ncbi:MAG: M15 family metallopeptidase [Prevotella sp.]|nr:M15 family metallopeptidase [Prevotella sp.]
MRTSVLLVLTALSVCLGCGRNADAHNGDSNIPAADSLVTDVEEENIAAIEDTVPFYARRLMTAYPDYVQSYDDGMLVFADGSTLQGDDGREKTFVEMLDDCDAEDMFTMTYDTTADSPAYLNDCGRGRCEPLFKKMYGKSETEVRSHLVNVEWFGQRIPFTSINGASRHLADVAAELAAMPQLRRYLTGASSFYWRKVRGANRQSAHSYGIAIDINTSFSNYWLWSNPGKSETDRLRYENRIPQEIVAVFEKHGFIWGGRWYHYDTMHFEYRPEFLPDFQP